MTTDERAYEDPGPHECAWRDGYQALADFRGWLTRALADSHWSQRELGARSGVDHSTISRLLRGDREPTLATALKIVEVLA